MPNTLRDFLDEHEATVRSRIDKLRAELAPLERELADVRRAKSALTQESRLVVTNDGGRVFLRATSGSKTYFETTALPPDPHQPVPRIHSPYASLTMKDLVQKALREHFPSGATANELLRFFADAWGRTDIVRTSLSPQLSRLKKEGVVVLDGMTWRLAYTDHEEEDDDDDFGALLGLPKKTAADQ